MDAAASSGRSNGAAAASALPDEIVEEILARLPAKSLLRFRCVSRPWRDLITSPAFRDLHSRRAGRHGRRLFIRQAGCCEDFYACDQPGGPVEEILSSSKFPLGNVFPINRSCHGLVLLRCVEYFTHYVWNPSTGELLTLPDRTPFKTVGYAPRTFVSYGMGCCSATKQYKVVRMYWLGEPREATVCEVFTLDKSTYWRPAATEPPVCRLRVRGTQGAVLCNGNLHFVGQGGIITTFNVTDETFGTLTPPPEFTRFDLTELDGCLCVYHARQVNPMPGDRYEIWLLRDYYASKACWEKLRCIDWGIMTDVERTSLGCEWIEPLAMCPDSSAQANKIMFGTSSCKLFVVDASNGGNPEILMEGVQHDGQFSTMGFFEESLVSLGRTSEEIILSSPSAYAWFNVLSWLPARMVGRLNQVCQDWRAMIKGDYFVDTHLYNASLNRSPKVMFTDGKPHSFKSMENFMNTSDVPPLIDNGSRVVCSKPCHGLNAGSFMCYDFVCNPVTGYYKALPLGDDDRELRPNKIYMDIAMRSLDYKEDTMFAGRLGLGYDIQVGMHVLVRMTYKERNLATRDYKLECEIRYVEGRYWEDLDPPQRPIADMAPAYTNGKFYWMVDGKLGQRSLGHEIIALDVSTLEFEVLQGPPLSHGNSERVSIVELQGLVCMVFSYVRMSAIEIWAMKDTGLWSMKYHIELGRFSPEYSPELVTPIAIDPKDGRILLSTGRALGYYDPKTGEIQTIYCLGKHIQSKKFVPILFQESLVNPCDRTNC